MSIPLRVVNRAGGSVEGKVRMTNGCILMVGVFGGWFQMSHAGRLLAGAGFAAWTTAEFTRMQVFSKERERESGIR